MTMEPRIVKLPRVDAEGWCTGCNHRPNKRGDCLCVRANLRHVQGALEARAASPDRPEPADADLAERLAALTKGVAPGPWHAEGRWDSDLDMEWWLENPNGDCSFPTPEDVAALLNAALRASPDRLAGGLDEAWAAAETALPDGWDFGLTRTMEGRHRASAAPPHGLTMGLFEVADTPAAALRALADRLSGLTEERT